MRATQDWNIDAELQVECIIEGFSPNMSRGEWELDVWNLSQDQQLPREVSDVVETAIYRELLCGDERFDETPLDIFIRFNSRGYYDPGCTYGPPENCYPPEGDDERTLIEVRMEYGDDSTNVPLTGEEQQAIFDGLQNIVDEYEIEEPDDDYPEDTVYHRLP